MRWWSFVLRDSPLLLTAGMKNRKLQIANITKLQISQLLRRLDLPFARPYPQLFEAAN
jgi:hypothetical protein